MIATGSISPVGRMICSTKTPPVRSISQPPGVAETVDRLRPHGVPFLELQGAVVHAGRQPEAVLGQRKFAPVVAPVHAADLRYGDMAFVDEDDGVVGNVFEQGRRRLAGLATGEIARIVLDPGAMPVASSISRSKLGALFQPLCLQQLVVGLSSASRPSGRS